MTRRRVLRIASKVLGTTLAVVALALVGLLAAINSTAVRRIIMGKIDGVLESTFEGKITVERIGHIGLTGVSGLRVRIAEREGAQVLFVDGVSVELPLLSIARSALFGNGDLDIVFSDVSLAYVDANIDSDSAGDLRLAKVFVPKVVKASDPAARATVVRLTHLAVRHLWVHGQPKGAPLVDADVDDLAGSFLMSPKQMALDVDKVQLATRSMPSGANLHLYAEAHYAAPGTSGSERFIDTVLRGDVGGIPASMHATLDGKDVAAMVDIPRVAAELVRAIVPSAPVYLPVSAHVDAHGRLPEIEAAIKVTAGPGSIEANTHAHLADETTPDTTIHAIIVAKDIDAKAFSRTGPASNLAANLGVDAVAKSDGAITGTYTLDLPPGDIDKNRIPAAHLHGDVQSTMVAGERVSAGHVAGVIEERGARTEIDAALETRNNAPAVHFEAHVAIPRLEETRLGSGTRGSADVRASGTLSLGTEPLVDADLGVTALGLAHGEQSAQTAWLRAHARGVLANPRIDAILQVHDLAAGNMKFSNAVATVVGEKRELDVTLSTTAVDAPKINADARLELGDVTTVRHASVALSRDDVRVVALASLLRVGNGELRAEGVRIEGLGDTLRADARRTGTELSLQMSTNELDMPKLAKLLRLPDVDGGHLALDIDMSLQKSGARGHGRVDLTQAAFARRVKDGNAHVELEIAGRQISGNAHAQLGDFGKLDVDTLRGELGGDGPLDMASLESAWGTVAFDSQLDVSKIKSLLPRGSVPLDEMQGTVRVTGELHRAKGAAPPSLQISLATKALVLSGKGERERVGAIRVVDTPPWRIEGVDLDLKGEIASESGATSLAARLVDREGTLVSVDARAHAVPYAEWLRAKTVSPGELGNIPLQIELQVPRRAIAKLPALLQTKELEGDVTLQIRAEGTLRAPSVDISVATRGFGSHVLRTTEPIDANVTGHYEKGAGKIDLLVGPADAPVLNASVRANGSLDAWLEKRDAEQAWSGSGQVTLTSFPLESLALLSDFQMKGRVSGKVSLDDLHKDARADGEVLVQDLKLGKVVFPRGNARVSFDGALARAALHLDQTDGQLDVQGQMGMDWGNRVVPVLKDQAPAVLDIKAAQLHAAAALPFLTSVVSDLDGLVDANAHVEFAPGAAPKMGGTVSYKGGVIQLNRMGEQLHDVSGKIAFSPDGNIKLDDFVAFGSTGRVMMSGAARMDGLVLANAEAQIRIPSNDPLPVDIDGQPLGDLEGELTIKAEASQSKRAMTVSVDVPRLHVALPLSSTNKVQELGGAAKIRVGYFRKARQFVLLPKDAEDLDPQKPTSASSAEETTVAVHLGDDIEIRKGTTLRVLVTGNPVVHLADKTRVTGQVQLKRGILEVQSKRFEIEKGTVSFVGDDPSNPQILVTAGWSAPDGTRVYADFVGPLKTGKVTLRSEPNRPQDEILSLILFGSADGMASSSYKAPPRTTSQQQAGAVAGGFATEGLSKGLDDLTGLDVSTKIDTTDAGNPKPELELQIARDIALQIGYVVGELPLGTNQDKTLVTVDWRFRKNWSLDATFGDKGSTIMDMVWQYRY